jgi:hypothetical protein
MIYYQPCNEAVKTAENLGKDWRLPTVDVFMFLQEQTDILDDYYEILCFGQVRRI